VGKGTVIKRLLELNPHFKLSVSCSTRAMRPGEVNGKDYDFVTEEEFDARIKNKYFLEWAEVHGNKYGTSVKFFEDIISHGSIGILEVDVQGAVAIKKKKIDAIYLFIAPPKFDELQERLKKRNTENLKDSDMRMQTALKEIEAVDHYDHVIINDEVEKTAKEISDIIHKEVLK
jgi:guanylate kinase